MATPPVADDHGLFSDPPPGAAVERRPRAPHGTADLVVGVLALVCALAGFLVLPLLAAVPLAVVGVALGATDRRRAAAAGTGARMAGERSRATVGLALSLAALAVALVWVVVLGDEVRLVLDQCDPDLADAQFRACLDQHF